MNTKKRRTSFDRARTLSWGVLLSVIFIVSQAVPVLADERQEAQQVVEKACMTLENFASDRNMGGFRDLLAKAKGVVIAPSYLKGAFVIGASGGNAVAMIRDQNGHWSAPAFYSIGGASFGLQIGGQASEVILLAMTDRGVSALTGSSFKLGVDAGVAAGPVGIGAAAASANLSADILSFSRSKGLYGGIALDGAVVAVRDSLNEAYYNKKVTPTDIMVRNEVKNPQTACLVKGLAAGSTESKVAAAVGGY